jgi:hypothetical protein
MAAILLGITGNSHVNVPSWLCRESRGSGERDYARRELSVEHHEKHGKAYGRACIALGTGFTQHQKTHEKLGA